MSSTRQTSRDALVTLLTTALAGTVKTVTGSKVLTLAGLTPLVSVLSTGTERVRLTYQGDMPTFHLEVQVWVLQATTGWTNAEAEDALDSIEALVAGVVEDNRGTANWQVIEYDGASSVHEIDVAGIPYYMERVPIKAILAKS